MTSFIDPSETEIQRSCGISSSLCTVDCVNECKVNNNNINYINNANNEDLSSPSLEDNTGTNLDALRRVLDNIKLTYSINKTLNVSHNSNNINNITPEHISRNCSQQVNSEAVNLHCSSPSSFGSTINRNLKSTSVVNPPLFRPIVSNKIERSFLERCSQRRNVVAQRQAEKAEIWQEEVDRFYHLLRLEEAEGKNGQKGKCIFNTDNTKLGNRNLFSPKNTADFTNDGDAIKTPPFSSPYQHKTCRNSNQQDPFVIQQMQQRRNTSAKSNVHTPYCTRGVRIGSCAFVTIATNPEWCLTPRQSLLLLRGDPGTMVDDKGGFSGLTPANTHGADIEMGRKMDSVIYSVPRVATSDGSLSSHQERKAPAAVLPCPPRSISRFSPTLFRSTFSLNNPAMGAALETFSHTCRSLCATNTEIYDIVCLRCNYRSGDGTYPSAMRMRTSHTPNQCRFSPDSSSRHPITHSHSCHTRDDTGTAFIDTDSGPKRGSPRPTSRRKNNQNDQNDACRCKSPTRIRSCCARKHYNGSGSSGRRWNDSTAIEPQKYQRLGIGKQRGGGHVAPFDWSRGGGGHVSPRNWSYGGGGHVAPFDWSRGGGGHVSPRNWSYGGGGHVAPFDWSRGGGGHVSPRDWSRGGGGHVTPRDWSRGGGGRSNFGGRVGVSGDKPTGSLAKTITTKQKRSLSGNDKSSLKQPLQYRKNYCTGSGRGDIHGRGGTGSGRGGMQGRGGMHGRGDTGSGRGGMQGRGGMHGRGGSGRGGIGKAVYEQQKRHGKGGVQNASATLRTLEDDGEQRRNQQQGETGREEEENAGLLKHSQDSKRSSRNFDGDEDSLFIRHKKMKEKWILELNKLLKCTMEDTEMITIQKKLREKLENNIIMLEKSQSEQLEDLHAQLAVKKEDLSQLLDSTTRHNHDVVSAKQLIVSCNEEENILLKELLLARVDQINRFVVRGEYMDRKYVEETVGPGNWIGRDRSCDFNKKDAERNSIREGDNEKCIQKETTNTSLHASGGSTTQTVVEDVALVVPVEEESLLRRRDQRAVLDYLKELDAFTAGKLSIADPSQCSLEGRFFSYEKALQLAVKSGFYIPSQLAPIPPCVTQGSNSGGSSSQRHDVSDDKISSTLLLKFPSPESKKILPSLNEQQYESEEQITAKIIATSNAITPTPPTNSIPSRNPRIILDHIRAVNDMPCEAGDNSRGVFEPVSAEDKQICAQVHNWELFTRKKSSVSTTAIGGLLMDDVNKFGNNVSPAAAPFTHLSTLKREVPFVRPLCHVYTEESKNDCTCDGGLVRHIIKLPALEPVQRERISPCRRRRCVSPPRGPYNAVNRKTKGGTSKVVIAPPVEVIEEIDLSEIRKHPEEPLQIREPPFKPAELSCDRYIAASQTGSSVPTKKNVHTKTNINYLHSVLNDLAEEMRRKNADAVAVAVACMSSTFSTSCY